MSLRQGGDPGSVSALGGTLRRQAITLADLVADLEDAAAQGARRKQPDPTPRERDLIARLARELDAVGAALQAWTTTVIDGAARSRSLLEEARATGLVIEGSLVVESPGPSRVDPAERLRTRRRLQELLNRVTAAEGRELARVARELARSAPVLASLSQAARTGT